MKAKQRIVRRTTPALLALILSAQAAAAQGGPGVPQAETTNEQVKLADLVAEAERNFPSIRAAARMVEARKARVPQARTFPDPQLSVGYVGDPAPFKTQANDPSSFRTFGVMQEIPYPGKRALRADVAAKEAEAEEYSVEAERRRVRAGVKTAYYELAGVQHLVDVTERNRTLLERLAKVAEENYKVGRGRQQDVLRAQVEVTRVRQRLALLEQRRSTLKAQINSWLARPPDSPLGPAEPLERVPLAYGLEELLAKGAENSPELGRQQKLIEQSRLAADLARKEALPDFSVGWDYMNRASGQPEMFGLRLTMSLPVFSRARSRDAVREAAETEAGARLSREAARAALQFEIKEQFLAARTAEELMNLYTRALVPQSTLALESSLAAFSSGGVDFQSVLANFQSMLDYEAGYFEELVNFQKARARLEELTGLNLNDAAAQPAPQGK
jgi:outer membrane protein TolC